MFTQAPLASSDTPAAVRRSDLPALSSGPASHPTPSRRSSALAVLCTLWFAIFFTSLFAPPLLDDADATHANAARHILTSGDWVTLYVNGIRYLEKAPLPYWLVAGSFRLFGFNTFAAHLPQAVAVLLLALLGYAWSTKAFSPRTGLYTGIFILTSAGVFLFTRIFIPEVWLSLFLATALYTFLRCLTQAEDAVILTGAQNTNSTAAAGLQLQRPLQPSSHQTGSALDAPPSAHQSAPWSHTASSSSRETTKRTHALHPYLMWTSLALAVLTKGLVAPVFFFGTAIVYLALTGEYRQWRRLKPFTGPLLLLAIAAPWHILAGLRNQNGFLLGQSHGFFWFYFINEHFLRFLGKRYPVDYNKLPGYLFWSLHLVWLFPWALFAPLLFTNARHRFSSAAASLHTRFAFTHRTTLLLTLYSALVLLFFSFSTNQEYYTFPAYLPLLMLIAAALTRAESTFSLDRSSRRWITAAHATLTGIGLAVAAALFLGLWTSRHLPFVPDIGDLLAHRGVGDYTLSMSHLFDLTGPSFAGLRLPAILAAVAFAVGPLIAWFLRAQGRHLASTGAIALTSATFLIAAHIALVRFGPMLSSRNLAAKVTALRDSKAIAPNTEFMLYGDQSYGSSILFYLGQQVPLVEGRSSSMIFGSSFPDAPHIFLTNADLLADWGTGPRKLLFVPLERRDDLDRLLPTNRQLVLAETSGKALITDRPLDIP